MGSEIDLDLKKITPEEIADEMNAYSFTVSQHIHERLDRHVFLLKKLIQRGASKQKWVVDAIKEKLTNDETKTSIPKANTIYVKIDDNLKIQMEKRIEFMKNFCSSYSKKRWLVDAVVEKLERDEKEVDMKLSELNKDQ